MKGKNRLNLFIATSFFLATNACASTPDSLIVQACVNQNENNICDSGDIPIQNLPVTINSETQLTDQQGRTNFVDIPENYNLSATAIGTTDIGGRICQIKIFDIVTEENTTYLTYMASCGTTEQNG